MALNVSYKNIIGYCTETQSIRDLTKTYRITICHANALCAFMYFDDQDCVQLVGFLADIQHLKNIIKNDDFESVFGEFDDFVFDAKELNKDLWRMIGILAEQNKHITITNNDEYINSRKA